VKIRSYQPFAGTGFFDFRDNGRQVLGVFIVDGSKKVTHGFGIAQPRFDFRKWRSRFLRGHFLGLGGKDFIEDIGHKWLSVNTWRNHAKQQATRCRRFLRPSIP